ncbi:MAG: DUF111 family protein, partial [Thermodesulfobacteria bacterium]|nr:DUF111 family protein [Thermodesulfobacteriota bacterium]
MNIAYLDLVGGLSGDMFLAALLDVGLPEGDLRKLLAALPGGLDLRSEEAFQCGLRGRRVIVLCSQPGALPATRDELLSLVKGLRLPKNLLEKLLALLEELFRAEAKVHGLSPEAVHLHELSSYDTLADLVGVLWGLEELGVSELFSSA